MRQFTCPKAVAHPSTNRGRCRATALIETNALPLHQTANCMCVDVDYDCSEEDEKERRQLIEQVFELQNTLDGLQPSTLLSLVITLRTFQLNYSYLSSLSITIEGLSERTEHLDLFLFLPITQW